MLCIYLHSLVPEHFTPPKGDPTYSKLSAPAPVNSTDFVRELAFPCNTKPVFSKEHQHTWSQVKQERAENRQTAIQFYDLSLKSQRKHTDVILLLISSC